MAISYEQRQEVIALLVGMFDAAPNSDILSAFVTRLEDGESVADIANDMDDHALFTGMYPNYLTNEEFATKFTTTLLDGNSTADGLAAGIQAVQDLLDAGFTQGETAQIAANFLMDSANVAGTDWEDAATAFQNKVSVATTLATTSDAYADADLDALQEIIADVDATADSVSDAEALIALGVVSEDDFDQYLTVDQDFIDGTNGDDMFRAYIFDNQNTAQSGDMIDGGTGTDTLYADVGTSQEFAITLHTDDVEVAMFRAQSADNEDQSDNDIQDSDGDDGIDRNVQIDAERMNGTEQFWSAESRANLTIEDIQRNSHETTIGWRNSDAGDVNYEVYFDNITAPDSTTQGSQLFLEVLDLEGMRTDSEPLLNNPYVGFSFTMDGVQYDLAAASPVSGVGATYQDFVDGINALLDAEGLDTVEATLGSGFTAINSDNGVAYAGTTMVLTNTGPEILSAVGWLVNGALPPDSNVHTSIDDTPPATSDKLTQTNIIFDYVGSGSKSEDFVAGEISQGANSDSAGIEQFNIDVDRTSWLNNLRSTNNTLEEVYVESIGSAGAFRLDSLDDVRVFDATSMINDVTLSATLSDDVIAKYFDLDDDQADETADNVEFNYYTHGTNDTITLEVSEEAAAHEDFELTISTGTGNDVVTLMVNDFDGGELQTNWEEDQEALDNIIISTGSGNDVVNTYGGGSATIATGSGDDTVYSDNSGTGIERATWVFNAVNTDIDDILGAGEGTSRFIGTDATLTVSFSAGTALGGGVTEAAADALGVDDNDNLAEFFSNGFESTVAIPVDSAEFTANSASVVQAIKDAINSDNTLNKLLEVIDGPNHALIVKSKVDGLFTDDDLAVSFNSWAAEASELTSMQDEWEFYNSDSSIAALTQNDLDAQVLALAGQGVGFNSNSELATQTSLGALVDVSASNTAASLESFAVTFSGVTTTTGGATPAASTLDYDGVTLTLAAGATSATALAIAFQAAHNGNGTNYTSAVTGAGVVTFTQIQYGNDPAVPVVGDFNYTDDTAADADAVAIAAVAAPTDGAGEVQLFDVTSNGWAVANGGSLTFVVNGTSYIYNNDSGSLLTGDDLEADIAADMTLNSGIVAAGYTVTNLTTPGTDDLAIQQTGFPTLSDLPQIAVYAGTGSVGDVDGASSAEEANDNVINVDTGDDVIVLSTVDTGLAATSSNETIVFDDYANGNVDIFNFDDGTSGGQGQDFLLLWDYLVNRETLPAGSTSEASQTVVPYTITEIAATGTDNIVDGNTVTIITDLNQTATQTWDGLTAALLLAAVQETNTTGSADYADIDEATLEVNNGNADLVGTSLNHVVFVENDLNLGEYKVFHLTSLDGTTDDFDSAQLIGTVDFGASVDLTLGSIVQE